MKEKIKQLKTDRVKAIASNNPKCYIEKIENEIKRLEEETKGKR